LNWVDELDKELGRLQQKHKAGFECSIDWQPTEMGLRPKISPKISEHLKVDSVVVFDLDFEKLQTLASEEHEFRPVSRYPAATRDISILVPQEVLVEKLAKLEDEEYEKLRRSGQEN